MQTKYKNRKSNSNNPFKTRDYHLEISIPKVVSSHKKKKRKWGKKTYHKKWSPFVLCSWCQANKTHRILALADPISPWKFQSSLQWCRDHLCLCSPLWEPHPIADYLPCINIKKYTEFGEIWIARYIRYEQNGLRENIRNCAENVNAFTKTITGMFEFESES